MKEELIGKQLHTEGGFSTLEMLIALAVLVITLAGTITVAFSNQSIAIANETNTEALGKAERALQTLAFQAHENFNSVISQGPVADSIYTLETAVQDFTQCKKQVTERARWSFEALRPQLIELSTTLTSPKTFFENGNDCGGDEPGGGWTQPGTLSSVDFSPAGSKATDLDVINKIVFMTADDPSENKRDFYVFDATDSVNPIVKTSIDTGKSLNALDAILSKDGNYYVFAAQASSTNQLQVISVSNDLSSSSVITERTLPEVSGTYPEGRSIFYYKNRVYIGTHYNGPSTNNKEFHIYNVSNPVNPTYLSGIKVYHNVNDIVVREQKNGSTTSTIAYLATSGDTEDLIVLDVSDPQNPTEITTIDVPGDADAKSIYVLGNKLYLGKEKTSGGRSDLFIFDITNPTTGVTMLGSTYLGAQDINGIQVAGQLVFLGTGDANLGFKVLDISNPANILKLGEYNFSENTSAIDYENDIIYTANRSNKALRIIRPAECADKIDDDADSKIDTNDPQCHADGNANNPASYNPEDDKEAP